MFFRRVVSPRLESSSSRNKVRLLFGARQTGKTEMLRRLLTPGAGVYYDLGQTAERRRLEQDPGALARELRALPRGVTRVVIDEIQKVPALLDEVQSLYDERRTRLQFFLTGSSARRLRQGSANLLPGRSHLFHLSPVCRWEIDGPARVAWAGAELNGNGPLPKLRGFPEQSLARTLLLGSLPGIRLESRTAAAATLSAYVENYLEEEIRREAVVRELGSFATFLRLAAAESGQQVNLAHLSRESGVPAMSLKNYYQVLEDTFVGHWLRPYSRRGRKRLFAAPRFLLFDTGVRNAAAGLSFDEHLLASEGPRLLEQWVGLELVSRARYRGAGHRVSFWRTVSGAEVDFVWESPREDVPVEVKWSTRPHPGDARHVETFIDESRGRSKRGLIVCRCERPQQISDRVLAVPWDRF